MSLGVAALEWLQGTREATAACIVWISAELWFSKLSREIGERWHCRPCRCLIGHTQMLNISFKMFGKHSECECVFFTLLDLYQVPQVGFEAICVVSSWPFLAFVRELLSTSSLPVYRVFRAGV